MSSYYSSAYPSDYPKVEKVFKGINIYNKVPNVYNYSYEIRPYQTFYNRDSGTLIGNPNKCSVRTEITAKPYPYTNRPTPNYDSYSRGDQPKKIIIYQSLIDDLNLRPAYTFYKNNNPKFLV
jgi:hypothetical protein